ncbi:hypothetical protein CEUSTIGMA_g3542.t1 [Chlamydomonas eustigma]|uniref:SET domain-containing protein n=1 Tax=Chlamydomonas eustigma TaxID=1157962 RepID=A0A250WZH5_9CHLO|nr:hypothetical protein CEUSTIGMA_g3542.t1 [Chlamydomonas eustigma]|eukprot:GAX76099.1 hypothetical protein CEUSTIGMA_g3542.t1 [Chlamydomonas eustigma]
MCPPGFWRFWRRRYSVNEVDVLLSSMSEAAVLKARQLFQWILSFPESYIDDRVIARLDNFGGLGLFVDCNAEPVKSGTNLLSIPISCMMECPPDTPAGSQHAALAKELIKQRGLGTASKWWTYIECLPSPDSLMGMPLFQHFHEMHSSLGGNFDDNYQSIVFQNLSASPSTKEPFSLLIQRTLTEFKGLCLQNDITVGCDHGIKQSIQSQHGIMDYVWARCIVSSRAIQLWSGPTLVPGVDFLNHDRQPNVVCSCISTNTETTSKHRSIYSPPSSSEEGDWEVDELAPTSESTPKESAVNDGIEPSREEKRPERFFVCESIHDINQEKEILWTYNAHSLDIGWLLGYGFVPGDDSSSQGDLFMRTDENLSSYQPCIASYVRNVVKEGNVLDSVSET